MLFVVDKDKIKQLRLERGLTLEQLGEAVYIKAGALHNIEVGVKDPSVKLEVADMLSEILLNERIDDDEVDKAYKCIQLLKENIGQELENLTYFEDMLTKKIKNDNWLNAGAEYRKFELFK